MTTHWVKRTQEEIEQRVFAALNDNINYDDQGVLGVPASFLDEKVFNQDASFLKEAPFISTLVKNPNHIGCHTLGTSESFFKGTQQLEKELIQICSVDILKGATGEQDGYVASGGTEANIQAIWIYRNFFQQEYNATLDEIVILCSEDSHYSMNKAANLLSIDIIKTPVVHATRNIDAHLLEQYLSEAASKGKKYFITIANMMTTMFGSVDKVEVYVEALKKHSVAFKMHIDGAYGGFYYPFCNEQSAMTFANPNISSFTLDAHKMAQAPYGTGIFLARKGLIKYANTQEASYVEGEDFTLIGSRSGANAVAVWMILSKNGPFGWHEKIFILQKRTSWLCEQLDNLGIEHYRNPHSNIAVMKANQVSEDVAKQFGLVPDNHTKPAWYKVVVMEHVTMERLSELVSALGR